MSITRREFLQMLAVAAAYGLPLTERAGAAALAYREWFVNHFRNDQ